MHDPIIQWILGSYMLIISTRVAHFTRLPRKLSWTRLISCYPQIFGPLEKNQKSTEHRWLGQILNPDWKQIRKKRRQKINLVSLLMASIYPTTQNKHFRFSNTCISISVCSLHHNPCVNIHVVVLSPQRKHWQDQLYLRAKRMKVEIEFART